MTIERYIRLMAGFFIMLSLALGVEASPIFHSPWWLAVTAFVGFNLFQLPAEEAGRARRRGQLRALNTPWATTVSKRR